MVGKEVRNINPIPGLNRRIHSAITVSLWTVYSLWSTSFDLPEYFLMCIFEQLGVKEMEQCNLLHEAHRKQKNLCMC